MTGKPRRRGGTSKPTPKPVATKERKSSHRGRGNREQNNWQRRKLVTHFAKILTTIVFAGAVIWWLLVLLLWSNKEETQWYHVRSSDNILDETQPWASTRHQSDLGYVSDYLEVHPGTLLSGLDVENLEFQGPDGNVAILHLQAIVTTDAKNRPMLCLGKGSAPGQGDLKQNETWVPLEDVLDRVNPPDENQLLLVLLDAKPLEMPLQTVQQSDFSTAVTTLMTELKKTPETSNPWKNTLFVLSHSAGQRNWHIPGLGKSVFQNAIEQALINGLADRRNYNSTANEDGKVSVGEFLAFIEQYIPTQSGALSMRSNETHPVIFNQTGHSALQICYLRNGDEAIAPIAVAETPVDKLDMLWGRLEAIQENWLHENPISYLHSVAMLLRMEKIWQQERTGNKEWKYLSLQTDKLLPTKPPARRIALSFVEKHPQQSVELARSMRSVRLLFEAHVELRKAQEADRRQENQENWQEPEEIKSDSDDDPNAPKPPEKKSPKKIAKEQQDEIRRLTSVLLGDELTPLAIWKLIADEKAVDRINASELQEYLDVTLTWFKRNASNRGSDWVITNEAGSKIDLAEIQFLKLLYTQTDWSNSDNLSIAIESIVCRDYSERICQGMMWQMHREFESSPVGETTENSSLMGDQFVQLESRRRRLEDSLTSNLLETRSEFVSLKTDYLNLLNNIVGRTRKIRQRNRQLCALPFLNQLLFENQKTVSSAVFESISPNSIVFGEPDTLFDVGGLNQIVDRFVRKKKLGQRGNEATDAETRVVSQLLLATPLLEPSVRATLRNAYRASSKQIVEGILTNDPGAKSTQTEQSPTSLSENWDTALRDKMQDVQQQLLPIATFGRDHTYENIAGYLAAVGDQQWQGGTDLMTDPFEFASSNENAWLEFLLSKESVIEQVRFRRLLNDFWGDQQVASNEFYFDLVSREFENRFRPAASEVQYRDALLKTANAFRAETGPSPTPKLSPEEEFQFPAQVPTIADSKLDRNAIVTHELISQNEQTTVVRRTPLNAFTGKVSQPSAPIKFSGEVDQLKQKFVFRGHLNDKFSIEPAPIVIEVPKVIKTVATQFKPNNQLNDIKVFRRNPKTKKRLVVLVDCSKSVGSNMASVQKSLKEAFRRLSLENAYEIELVAFGRTKNFKAGEENAATTNVITEPDEDFIAKRLGPSKVSSDTVVLSLLKKTNFKSIEDLVGKISELEPFGMTPLYAAMLNTIEFHDSSQPIDRLLIITDGIDYTYQVNKDGDLELVDWRVPFGRLKDIKDTPGGEIDFQCIQIGNPRLQRDSYSKKFNFEAAIVDFENLFGVFKKGEVKDLRSLILQRFEFPEISIQVADQNNETRIPSAQIPYATELDYSKDFTVATGKDWYKKRATATMGIVKHDERTDREKRILNESLEFSLMPRDTIQFVLDESQNRFQFAGPSPNHFLRSDSNRVKRWKTSHGSYRVGLAEHSTNNVNPVFQFWNHSETDQLFTFRPAMVSVEAIPQSPQEMGYPKSILIQDSDVFQVNNVVMANFSPFNKRTSDGQSSPFQIGKRNVRGGAGNESWVFRLYAWENSPSPDQQMEIDLKSMNQDEWSDIKANARIASTIRVRQSVPVGGQVEFRVELSRGEDLQRVIVQVKTLTGQPIELVDIQRDFKFVNSQSEKIVHRFSISRQHLEDIGGSFDLQFLRLDELGQKDAEIFEFTQNF